MGEITLKGYICERCSHEWVSRSKKNKKEEPRVCPACKSPYWNVPRKNKNKTVNPKKGKRRRLK